MTAKAFTAQMATLGLRATWHATLPQQWKRGCSPPGFWMVKCDGKEIGSFVPQTHSARVGSKMHKVANMTEALLVYGARCGTRGVA